MAARGTVTKLLESAGGRKGVYEGEVDAAGKAVGHGVGRANEDTTVYTGDFADDKMHGGGSAPSWACLERTGSPKSCLPSGCHGLCSASLPAHGFIACSHLNP